MVWEVPEFQISDLRYGLRNAIQSFISLISAMAWGMPSRASYLWSPLWSEECHPEFYISDLRYGLRSARVSDLWSPLRSEECHPELHISDLRYGLRSASVSDLWSPLCSEKCQNFRSLISAVVWGVPVFHISDLRYGLRSARVSDLWSPRWSEECQRFHISDLRSVIKKPEINLRIIEFQTLLWSEEFQSSNPQTQPWSAKRQRIRYMYITS
jgi:hypothetical protein